MRYPLLHSPSLCMVYEGINSCIASDKKPVMTLRPPAGQREWRTRNRIVVTEYYTDSLDIFITEGEIHMQTAMTLFKYIPVAKSITRTLSHTYADLHL